MCTVCCLTCMTDSFCSWPFSTQSGHAQTSTSFPWERYANCLVSHLCVFVDSFNVLLYTMKRCLHAVFDQEGKYARMHTHQAFLPMGKICQHPPQAGVEGGDLHEFVFLSREEICMYRGRIMRRGHARTLNCLAERRSCTNLNCLAERRHACTCFSSRQEIHILEIPTPGHRAKGLGLWAYAGNSNP